MQPHQQRVIDERAELKTRTEALSKFITANDVFSTLPNAEQNDMCGQLRAMTHYLRFLDNRIARF